MNTLQALALDKYLQSHPGHKVELSHGESPVQHDPFDNQMIYLRVLDGKGRLLYTCVGSSVPPLGNTDPMWNGVDQALIHLVTALASGFK